MTRRAFVDTSAWYALADEGDGNHLPAVRILEHLLEEQVLLLTTNHVAGESYTLIRTRLGSYAAREFLKRTRSSNYTQRLFVLEEWEEAAEDLLAQYQDQALSYVDATSFIAMRRLRMQEAFAFDQHFVVAGFVLVES